MQFERVCLKSQSHRELPPDFGCLQDLFWIIVLVFRPATPPSSTFFPDITGDSEKTLKNSVKLIKKIIRPFKAFRAKINKQM